MLNWAITNGNQEIVVTLIKKGVVDADTEAVCRQTHNNETECENLATWASKKNLANVVAAFDSTDRNLYEDNQWQKLTTVKLLSLLDKLNEMSNALKNFFSQI